MIMEEIITGKYLALFSQIDLVDANPQKPYPEWISGEEIAVMNEKGVSISALNDALIDVYIYKGDHPIEGIKYISGVIDVGIHGLLVGNEIAGTFDIIPWPSGKIVYTVYANAPKDCATKIIILLQQIY